MNIAVIFAGGSGRRMNAGGIPKQFLKLHGKPIIAYTLELFNNNPDIDAIYVACIENWIPELEKTVKAYGFTKVKGIVKGGETGQDSIYNALELAAKENEGENLVLIHDGVRPLIDGETISRNIEEAQQFGNCITCVLATETLAVRGEDNSWMIPSRKDSFIARAPQTFLLREVFEAHRKARSENRHDFIDTLTLMAHYGLDPHTIVGPTENIKITTPTDFFLFKAIVEARENSQIFGI